MYQRVGAVAMKKDLGNIVALCNALGKPQEKFKSIHIAGTNGKGSVTHLIAGVLQHTGLKVGCYTSPHYIDFRERIKINGALISEELVQRFVQDNKALIEQMQPSFFEITVAMAFSYFTEQEIDVAIIETGLGGRLDSTNILTPILSIITNIGLDHQAMLGNTLEEIAGEKAGIIKENIPVLIGEHQEQLAPIFRNKAKSVNAPYHTILDFPEVKNFKSTISGSSFQIHFTKTPTHFTSDVMGMYQRKNFRTAIAASMLLQQHFPLTLHQIAEGLENLRTRTHYIGRMMCLDTNPTILADSAHNEDGIKALRETIETIDHSSLHFVYGTVNDKDLSKILPLLPQNAKYYFCKPDVPRGLNASVLWEQARALGLNGQAFTSVTEAIQEAKHNADANDLIVISGSIFVVAEAI